MANIFDRFSLSKNADFEAVRLSGRSLAGFLAVSIFCLTAVLADSLPADENSSTGTGNTSLQAAGEAVRRLSPEMNAILSRELDFLESVRSQGELPDASRPLSARRLLANEDNSAVNWTNLQEARRVAYIHALRMGMPIDSVRYLSPAITSAIDKKGLALKHGVPTDLASRIEIYPIGNGNMPVVLRPSQSPNREWIVDGQPVRPIPPALLSSIDGLVPTIADVSGSGAALEIVNRFMWHGERVDPPSDELAKIMGDRRGVLGTLPKRVGERNTCDTGDDTAHCFLSTVALHDRWRTYCTGVLIASRWLLTAAHCACGGGASRATIGNIAPTGLNPERTQSLTIWFGDRVEYLNQDFCSQYTLYRGRKGRFPVGDLAMIELIRAVETGSADLYSEIGAPDHARQMVTVNIAGFGATEVSRTGGIKYQAGLLVPTMRCVPGETQGPQDSACVAGQEFVAINTKNGADSCYGDSGAGAFSRLKKGGYTLIGIVSRGITSECGEGSIQTLVTTSAVRAWIEGIAPSVNFLHPEVALAAENFRPKY